MWRKPAPGGEPYEVKVIVVAARLLTAVGLIAFQPPYRVLR